MEETKNELSELSSEDDEFKLKLKQATVEITKQKIELNEIQQHYKATKDKESELLKSEVLELKSEN